MDLQDLLEGFSSAPWDPNRDDSPTIFGAEWDPLNHRYRIVNVGETVTPEKAKALGLSAWNMTKAEADHYIWSMNQHDQD